MPDRIKNHNGLSSYLFVLSCHSSWSPKQIFLTCRGATAVEQPKRETKWKIHRFMITEREVSNAVVLSKLSRLRSREQAATKSPPLLSVALLRGHLRHAGRAGTFDASRA